MTSNEPMSHSRGSLARRCGVACEKKYGQKISEKPTLALIGGKTTHSVIEQFELERLAGAFWVPSFDEEFDRQLTLAEDESGLHRSEFAASGRRTKDHPDRETIEVWRRELGPDLIDKYLSCDWGGLKIATDLPPDTTGKTVGVEYAIELGNPRWRGFIDQIRVDRFGNYIPIDIKTGQRIYTSSQMPEYGCALQLWGITPCNEFGYYQARKGLLIGPSFNKWSPEVFRQYVNRGHKLFAQQLIEPVPNVDDHCGWCGYRESCEFAP